VVVAVIAVRVVQAPVCEIVDVISVRHRLVSAPVGVRVAGVAVGRLGVTVRMPGIHSYRVLVDVIVVGVVKMAFVEVIDVIIVAHRDMTASISMDMRVLACQARARARTRTSA
jgi:hypothetical protein